MSQNPYQPPKEVTEPRASTAAKNRPWRLLVIGIVIFVAGAVMLGLGMSIGMEGFDQGVPSTPAQELISWVLVVGGLGGYAIGGFMALLGLIWLVCRGVISLVK